MPIINVKMIAGRSQEKQELVAVLTRETAKFWS